MLYRFEQIKIEFDTTNRMRYGLRTKKKKAKDAP